VLDKIFEPFFTTKKVGRGTGLGLAISYGIVQDYEGTIRVETVENEGSKFIVQIPTPGEA
jgi:histidine kinase